jgi:hypothetical protein
MVVDHPPLESHRVGPSSKPHVVLLRASLPDVNLSDMQDHAISVGVGPFELRSSQGPSGRTAHSERIQVIN